MRHHTRILLLLVALLLVLAGCDFFVGLFDPLVGTWTATDPGGGSITFVLHGDRSFTISGTGYMTGTASGTYSADTEAKVLTLNVTQSSWTSGGPTVGAWVFTYSLSSDKKTLTVSNPNSGTMALTRQ